MGQTRFTGTEIRASGTTTKEIVNYAFKIINEKPATFEFSSLVARYNRFSFSSIITGKEINDNNRKFVVNFVFNQKICLTSL